VRISYNKLIRDRIPEIIRADGKRARVEELDESEYRQALLEKLVEEAVEAARASEVELSKELADLYEVIDAILAAWNIPREDVLALKGERRQQRGGFEKRLKLIWTE
jgi:predicted house-cleaning noncanonical NTP pyrophosphatase (MazG superfamily)